MNPSLPTAPSLPAAPTALDAELLALPKPPSLRRTLTLTTMILVMAAAFTLALVLRHDIAYFFAPTQVQDLGRAPGFDISQLQPNSLAHIAGVPMMSHAVTYERMLGQQTYAVFPLAGQRTMYVQVPLHAAVSHEGVAGAMRSDFQGRLTTFGQLGSRFSSVRQYLEHRMGMTIQDDTYVLLAEEPPSSYVWAVLLGLLCLLILITDLGLAHHWFRPLPSTSDNA